MNTRGKRLGWQTAGLFALVVGLAPATARAGCGDGQVPLHPTPVAHDPEPRPRPPCSGPMCSARLPLAPPAVPTVLVPTADDLAVLANDLSPAISQLSRRRYDEPSRRPVRPADAVFHPPALKLLTTPGFPELPVAASGPLAR